MLELCHRVLDGQEIPAEWATRLSPIHKWKGHIRNCSCFTARKLLVYGGKVVERVLDKKNYISDC